jgi:hypothetical protein
MRVLLPLDDTIYSRCPENISFDYSIVNERWQDDPAALGTRKGMLSKILVELIGIEPTTSGLQSQRSPN